MNPSHKPFVHVGIDAVDAVVFDSEGFYDPELFDRYETFEDARNAALTSVEVMLDEGDYDSEEHREELDRMRDMLERSGSYPELESLPGYRWFLVKLTALPSAAA